MLTSFAIPATFLAMPFVGYYHLTLLVFPIGFLLASKENRSWPLSGFLIIAAVVLGFPRPGYEYPFRIDPVTPSMYFALFCLWVVTGMIIAVPSFSPRSVIKS